MKREGKPHRLGLIKVRQKATLISKLPRRTVGASSVRLRYG